MRPRALVGGIALLTVLASVWVGRQTLHRALSPPRPHPGTQLVRVPRGASTASIARMLRHRRLIRSARVFRWTARYLRLDGRLQAGTYRITPRMGTVAILRTLSTGRVAQVSVTIPEGYTADQIADLLADKGLAERERMRRLFHSIPARWKPNWLPVDDLEGYLFPTTYLVPLGSSERQLTQMMLDRFHKMVVVGLSTDLEGSPLSLHEVVTLASLVEREAQVPEERPLIAGVLMNRIRRNMKLQCDATVQYALGRHRSRLLFKDLEVDSPYNTYLHPGLPPGPIANPGLECLRAALHPAETEYLFYVARPDGSHLFSKTFAEHRQAIRAVREAH